jgi:hypothetical protein
VSDDDELTPYEAKQGLVYGRVVNPVPRPPKVCNGLTKAYVEQRYAEVAESLGERPDQDRFAEELKLGNARTLQRALLCLDMPWPPGPPAKIV